MLSAEGGPVEHATLPAAILSTPPPLDHRSQVEAKSLATAAKNRFSLSRK